MSFIYNRTMFGKNVDLAMRQTHAFFQVIVSNMFNKKIILAFESTIDCCAIFAISESNVHPHIGQLPHTIEAQHYFC